MSFAFQPPPAIDLLAQAIDQVRRRLDRSLPIGKRIRVFWAGVVAARDFGAADVVSEEFQQLARDTGLTADLEHHGEEDVAHVIRWALLDQNPFC
jgi:hypothetical protein